MILNRTHAAVSIAALAGAAAVVFAIHMHAQTQTPAPVIPAAPAIQIPQPPARPQPAPAPAMARAVILLDPAHGGPDAGASLGNNVAEKDVTLAFAQRLRPALASSGFAVVTTRDNDPAAPLPTDQRAETANRVHALACIVIHATASGSGIHVFTSTLQPAPSAESGTDASTPFSPVPWESAQAGFVDQSRKLSDVLKATLAKTGLPIFAGTAPVRPLDNLMCPAVAIEIAPHAASNAGATSAADAVYQQQIATAIVSTLEAWRTQNTPSSPGLSGEAP